MAFDIDKEEIHVVQHCPDWIDKFRREADALTGIFCNHPFEIEHIGSTAVPGLKAKPIVDIAVKFETVETVSEYLKPLEEYGYHYFGEFILPRWHYLCRGEPREFNLHIVDDTTEHWEVWIRFRDILLTNERIREEYQQLKADLAEKHRYERQKYTQGKAGFVTRILQEFPKAPN